MNRGHMEIRVGLGSCSVAAGAMRVRDALTEALREAGICGTVTAVGCNGLCHREPLVEVADAEGRRTLYGNVVPSQTRHIVARHMRGLRWSARARWFLDSFRFSRHGEITHEPREVDVRSGPAAAYMARQKRIVLENCGRINPLEIGEYLAGDGYRALVMCLKTMTPGEVIQAVTRSGLRGRGGAGFPTGRKWAAVGAAPVTPKYVIGNGDEGDPGAFMDRLVLEADPHRVIEGLAITAYATGASQGYLYVRAEYPLAVRHVRHAIEQATERGFLGDRILDTDFSLRIEVREGAGAFVCGEETALIASIEGRRGMPRFRPPFPAERGLYGQPTCINNVETLACVPWIIRHGADAFASLGTATSKGTKVFALAGKINRGGLIEVPMGITIRAIVEEIGGGVRGERPLKAVQIGGPSGGCVPAGLIDTPIDYEELAQTGAIMGSGGLVVLDDRDCMVDVARFFVQFTQAESCGKCTFCRIGTKRMLEILSRLCEGRGREGDIDELADLADRVKRTSLCGLGHTAPNPVLTALRYFRDEFEAHLRDRRCPAGRCPALIRYRVTDGCIGCTLCAQACPVGAIAYRPHQRHEIDDAKCTRCGMCAVACQDNAIEVR